MSRWKPVRFMRPSSSYFSSCMEKLLCSAMAHSLSLFLCFFENCLWNWGTTPKFKTFEVRINKMFDLSRHLFNAMVWNSTKVNKIKSLVYSISKSEFHKIDVFSLKFNLNTSILFDSHLLMFCNGGSAL